MPASLKHGIFYTVLGYFFFAIASTLARDLSNSLPATQITFWQFFVILIGISVAIIVLKDTAHLRIHHPKPLIIRTIAGICAYYLFYYSIHYIPLVDAVLLNTAFPLYVPFIVCFWGGTRIHPKLWLGALIGFAGIVTILRPTPSTFNPMALIALVGGILSGIALVGIRRSAQVESPLAVIFYYSLTGTFVFAPWALTQPAPHSMILQSELIFVGISLLLLQYFSTEALEHAPASVLAPLCYSAVVFSGLFSWIIWGHTPDIYTIIGTLLVVTGAFSTIKVSS